MRRVSTPHSRMRRRTGPGIRNSVTVISVAQAWGHDGYAPEELIAEPVSAILCADVELTPEIRDDHASYMASSLVVLENDERAIFQAAAFPPSVRPIFSTNCRCRKPRPPEGDLPYSNARVF